MVTCTHATLSTSTGFKVIFTASILAIKIVLGCRGMQHSAEKENKHGNEKQSMCVCVRVSVCVCFSRESTLCFQLPFKGEGCYFGQLPCFLLRARSDTRGIRQLACLWELPNNLKPVQKKLSRQPYKRKQFSLAQADGLCQKYWLSEKLCFSKQKPIWSNYFYLLIYFYKGASVSLIWPQIHYGVEVGSELLIPLCPPPNCLQEYF